METDNPIDSEKYARLVYAVREVLPQLPTVMTIPGRPGLFRLRIEGGVCGYYAANDKMVFYGADWIEAAEMMLRFLNKTYPKKVELSKTIKATKPKNK